MQEQPDGGPDLERQRSEVETAFREGWRPSGADGPRVLTGHAHAEARRILSEGGWTGLDRATIQAVRGGAQPGDSLPPLQPRPFIIKVTDAEAVITGTGQGRQVAVLFSHQDFPGARFGHRFGPDGEPIELMEEIETGALHRMMRSRPAPDSAGVIWTTWGG